MQYHWILENGNDFEGIFISENGPQKEIVNSGEAVELPPYHFGLVFMK